MRRELPGYLRLCQIGGKRRERSPASRETQPRARILYLTGDALTGDARLEFLRNSGPAPEMREH